MKIKESKNCVTVVWSKKTEANLTWGEVRQYCIDQIVKMQNSKEAEQIAAYMEAVKMLNSKINAFNNRKARYQRMIDAIKPDEFNVKVGGDAE